LSGPRKGGGPATGRKKSKEQVATKKREQEVIQGKRIRRPKKKGDMGGKPFSTVRRLTPRPKAGKKRVDRLFRGPTLKGGGRGLKPQTEKGESKETCAPEKKTKELVRLGGEVYH